MARRWRRLQRAVVARGDGKSLVMVARASNEAEGKLADSSVLYILERWGLVEVEGGVWVAKSGDELAREVAMKRRLGLTLPPQPVGVAEV